MQVGWQFRCGYVRGLPISTARMADSGIRPASPLLDASPIRRNPPLPNEQSTSSRLIRVLRPRRKTVSKKAFCGLDRAQWNFVLPRRNHGGTDVWGWIVLRCSSTGAAETVFPPAMKGWMKRRRMKRPQAEAARRTFAGFEGAPGQALRQYLLGAASYQTQSKKRAYSRDRARTRAFFSAVPG